MYGGVQRLAELLYRNLMILVRKVQRHVQICAEVSEILTGPIMLKSLIFSNHYVLAEKQAFQQHPIGQICGNLCTLLEFAAIPLHFLLEFG